MPSSVSLLSPVALALLLTLASAPGCEDSRQAGQSAGEGATAGAVSGAIWGGVRSLVWGGNVAENMAVGAGAGAAAGAAVGGLHGGKKDAQLKAEFGVENYRAIMFAVDCEHDEARQALVRAAESEDRLHRLATLWIDATLRWDRGERELAERLYPQIVEADDETDTVAQVDTEVRSLVTKLRKLRLDLKGRSRCP